MSENDRLKSRPVTDPPRRVPPDRPAPPPPLEDAGEAEGPCPNCGAPMNAIRGSKAAICANCGFKDSCCF
jgi:hypothetical protein